MAHFYLIFLRITLIFLRRWLLPRSKLLYSGVGQISIFGMQSVVPSNFHLFVFLLDLSIYISVPIYKTLPETGFGS